MKKDDIFIISCVFAGLIATSIGSYQVGKDAMKKEAVVAGHALWSYDEKGNPKFHWKDQQKIIGEYLGLGK